MATIKLLSNSTALGVANTLLNATMVRVINTSGAEQTITIANTVGPENGGGTPGTVVIETGQTEIIVKEPTDTIVASNSAVLGTKVARY